MTRYQKQTAKEVIQALSEELRFYGPIYGYDSARCAGIRAKLKVARRLLAGQHLTASQIQAAYADA